MFAALKTNRNPLNEMHEITLDHGFRYHTVKIANYKIKRCGKCPWSFARSFRERRVDLKRRRPARFINKQRFFSGFSPFQIRIFFDTCEWMPRGNARTHRGVITAAEKNPCKAGRGRVSYTNRKIEKRQGRRRRRTR